MVQYDLGLDINDFHDRNSSIREQDQKGKEEQADMTMTVDRNDDDLSLDTLFTHPSLKKVHFANDVETNLNEDDKEDESNHPNEFEALRSQLRTSLIRQEDMATTIEELKKVDQQEAAADIHMLAVHYLVKSPNKDSKWIRSKAEILSVFTAFIVLVIQGMVLSYLPDSIVSPPCSGNGDCPDGSYCAYDYNIYGDKISKSSRCNGSCEYFHQYGDLQFSDPDWFKLLEDSGCDTEKDRTCIENISPLLLRNYCETRNVFDPYPEYNTDLCLNKVHCKDLSLEIGPNCAFVNSNREVLNFMGVFLLMIVGFLLAVSIHDDIYSGRKQLTYLQYNAPPGILKQICATVLVARCTCMPFFAITATVALMIGNPLDSQNIVLNALSIAFILEFDNVVGKFGLMILKLKEESIQKLEDRRDIMIMNGIESIVDYLIVALGMILFLVLILNRELLDLQCFELAVYIQEWGLIFVAIIGSVKALVAFYISYRNRSRRNEWRTLLWKLLTLLAAGTLYFSVSELPYLLSSIITVKSNFKIGSTYPTNIDGWKILGMIDIALFATFSILTFLIWILDYNYHEDEDTSDQGKDERFDDDEVRMVEDQNHTVEMNNEKTLPSQNMTRAKKSGILATVLFISVLAGLLGGLLPQLKKEACRFSSAEACTQFKKNFPNCNVEKPFLIGDGKYCNVDHPFWIGDGYCQGGPYNTEECGFDGGDCLEFNQKYPNCTLYELPFPFGGVLGDGWCVNWYNTEECGWENGDCVPPSEN
ncbi:hypothetical protein CTEN210_01004 [Chaetoceros tenuissimus]|uniref:LNR domain-containing protein n=1 Tax=Chaetoceros tenuissimus TaxID=426638 RepID=A0AAD3CG72_9STRA|nr:hypothetical protein CTEN210_01004 [Chaetoceros tenuissimus]